MPSFWFVLSEKPYENSYAHNYAVYLDSPFELIEDGGILPGDVNFDGEINLFDIMAVREHIFGNTLLTGDAFTAADMDGSGEIDIFDIMAIRDFIFG